VWNSAAKEGYKGVNIHGEAQVGADEMGKRLADGKEKVSFKTFGKKKKKQQNRRTTSADDD